MSPPLYSSLPVCFHRLCTCLHMLINHGLYVLAMEIFNMPEDLYVPIQTLVIPCWSIDNSYILEKFFSGIPTRVVIKWIRQCLSG